MIGKITAVIGAAAISGLITSVVPGHVPYDATGAAQRGNSPARQIDTMVVDHTNKGDRLIVGQRPSGSSRNEAPAPKTVPLGCDTVFSPVADPTRAQIFKRCMA